MPIFEASADLNQALDFQLLLNGPVTLFFRERVLAEACGWLEQAQYSLVVLDAHGWLTEADAHIALASGLHFPDYYGKNLDALNDCLSDVAAADYGLDPQKTGLVLVLVGYDAFIHHVPAMAQTVIDIFARQSRAALLGGHRMICLLQSDDPHIDLAPVGASPVLWNPSEWRESTRGLEEGSAAVEPDSA